MSTSFDIAAVVGSLRRGSYTRRLVQALMKLAPDSMRIEIVEIGTLQSYTQDLDSTPTTEWTMFRKRIARADAVLFATPEYNRSLPGVLKNAIDVGSRPYGQSVWARKPAAVISVSPGALGGFGANHHLRQSLVFLDMPTLQQPEAYIGGIATLVDEEGRITDEGRRKFFVGFLRAFEEMVRQWHSADLAIAE